MPRFELGTKFWIADVSHNEISIRWGEIGTTGKTVKLPRRRDAVAKLDELIAAKLAEGYKAVGEPVVVPAQARLTRRYEADGAVLEVTLDGRRVYQRRADDEPADLVVHPTADDARDIAERIARAAVASGMVLVRETSPVAAMQLEAASNPELLAQCRAAPDDPAPHAVYADWLIAQGDIRGELAARTASDEPSAIESLLARRLALFGGRAELAVLVEIVGYRFGFPSAVQIRAAARERFADLVGAVLELPLFELLDQLEIDAYAPMTDVVATLARSSHASAIRRLALGILDATAGPLLRELRALRELQMAGPPSDHPELRELRLWFDASALDALVRAALPKLERLELVPSHAIELDDGPRLRALLAVLDRTDLPCLRHLGIDPDERVIPALARSAVVRQLTSLDLSREPLTPTAGRLLADDAAAFRHLERIDVGRHRGSRLARELPNVRIVTAP